MVNASIPKHYTASPSSLSGTPHLTINHEATFDLDSSNAFEGPEKLLEVWFGPSSLSLPSAAQPLGLKAVSKSTWTEMLDLVNCRVLSVIESEHVDAYLLSESSLFVYPHKLVLKTCGTTTLLWGIPKMLEIAALNGGFPHTPANSHRGTTAAAATHRVFYSRKNYLYPNQQRGPHRSWRDEVKALDRLFKRGSAYMIGKMNGEHWYLYITEPQDSFTPPLTPEHEMDANGVSETKVIEVPESMAAMAVNGLRKDDDTDETLEILMTDLDEEGAKQFYLDHASTLAEQRYRGSYGISNGGTKPNACRRPSASEYDVFGQTGGEGLPDGDLPEQLTSEGHALGGVVSETCGLSEIYPTSKYPDARIDSYLFTPCGFSANGVIPTTGACEGVVAEDGAVKATNYFTVHVTPEPECSYASFETNVPAKQTGRETAEVVEQVVNIFRPGRFSVTLFEAKQSELGKSGESKARRMDGIKGYRRVDRIVHDLDGYDLVFRHFERYDFAGGAPRLGEDV